MSTEVNYSMDLLSRDFPGRDPIRGALERLIDRYSIKGRNVIELGSGLGFNLDLFSNANTVLGVEGIGDAANAATARGVPTMHGDLEHSFSELKDSTFDVALCLDVLEHLMNPLACIRETHRILKTGGIYIVNVPNHFSFGNRLRILAGAGVDAPKYFPESNAWNYPHVRFFKHESIVKVLNLGGFEIVEDWSAKFPAVPLLRKIPSFGSLSTMLAAWRPNLFCGGFFVIAKKTK